MKTIIYSNSIEEQGGSGPSPSDAIPQPDSASGSAGTSTTYSRGDHSHPGSGGSGPSPSTTIPLPDSDNGAVGTSPTYSRGDHSHQKVKASNTVLGMVKIGTGINISTDAVISAMSKKEYTATISSDPAHWTSGSQTITMTGIKATDEPIVDVVLPEDVSAAKIQLKEWAKIDRIKTAADTLVVICYDGTPSVDLSIRMQVFA